MAITFAWRSDQKDARYSSSGKTPGEFYKTGGTVDLIADAGAIGGQALDLWDSNNASIGLLWSGRQNLPSTKAISVLVRHKLPSGINTAFKNHLFFLGAGVGNQDQFLSISAWHEVGIPRTRFRYYDADQNNDFMDENSTAFSLDQYLDFVLTWTGDDSTNGFKFYLDNTLLAQETANFDLGTIDQNLRQVLCLGAGNDDASDSGTLMYANEFVIWDEVIDPGSVTLANGSSGALNGSSRSEFVQVDSFDGANYTDPGAGNVVTGIDYIFAGNTTTGTFDAPTPASGASGTVDLNNIKEQLQWIFEQANTTTADPVDLSSNMTNRVQNILKIHPGRIKPQASFYPMVTMYYDDKPIEARDMSVNQRNSRRVADLSIKIVGMTFLHQITDVKEDDADNDIENLMENIELTLRAYHDIAGTVNWQIPERVTYHNIDIEEDVFLRTGILTLNAKVFY